MLQLKAKRALEEQERQRLIEELRKRESQLSADFENMKIQLAQDVNIVKEKFLGELQDFEHFVEGDLDPAGISEDEILKHCEELFTKAPITFVPRKGEAADKAIKKLIDEMDVTIPIVWVKDSLYLVGINKIHL